MLIYETGDNEEREEKWQITGIIRLKQNSLLGTMKREKNLTHGSDIFVHETLNTIILLIYLLIHE